MSIEENGTSLRSISKMLTGMRRTILMELLILATSLKIVAETTLPLTSTSTPSRGELLTKSATENTD